MHEGVVRRITLLKVDEPSELLEEYGFVIKTARSTKGCIQFDLLQGLQGEILNGTQHTFQLLEAWVSLEAMGGFDFSEISGHLKTNLTARRISVESGLYTLVC